ncbi:replication initiator protein A [Trichlorobacter lovleyi]|uniref:replication initiator protein A n=1 Tax=Trichlorobacter lovleyi TaxID=313985 RepID=UPI0022403807|nr:replication initiator protein A [Trichlorobacter lovleyi]QOX78367.1 replication initiator protein A [Trichlorobacter lovleyi]
MKNKSSSVLRLDIATMKYPFFSVTGGEEKRQYQDEKRDVSLVISAPTDCGAPSVMDRDVLTYCQTRLRQLYGPKDLEVFDEFPAIEFSFRKFCATTGRQPGGTSMAYLERALIRLNKSLITTKNICVNKNELAQEPTPFIDFFEITKGEDRKRGRGNDVIIKVRPSRWVHKALIRDYLLVDPDFYNIKSPMARRLFEVGRAFVGDRPGNFVFDLDGLSLLLGLKSPRNKMLSMIKQHIPQLARLDLRLDLKRDGVVYSRIQSEPEELPPVPPELEEDYLNPMNPQEEAEQLLKELTLAKTSCNDQENIGYDEELARTVFGEP